MNRQEFEYWSRRYGLLFLVALSLVAFLLPLLLRLLHGGNTITPGPESYSYLRHADAISIPGHDLLHNTPLAPNPYVALLAIMQLFGVPWLLPVLLVLLLIVLLHQYLTGIIQSHTPIVLALITLVVAPSTSVLATHHTPTVLCLVFLLVALIIFGKHPVAGCMLILAAIITEPVLGFFAAGVYAVSLFISKQTNELVGVLLTAFAGVVWFIFWTGQLMVRGLLSPSFNPALFFEIGAQAGISIFLVLLAAYGMIVRPPKDQMLLLYAILLFVVTFFIPALLPATVIVLSIFAANGIYHLMTTQWELELLRSALLILVTCIGVFLIITSIRERIGEAPDSDFAHKMIVLRNQYHEGAVLTAPEYAPMVEYYSDRRAALDENTPASVVHDAFLNRSSAAVYPLLTGTETSYVLITADMRHTMFKRSDDGILFLLQNTERFVIVEQSNESTLWYFISTT